MLSTEEQKVLAGIDQDELVGLLSGLVQQESSSDGKAVAQVASAWLREREVPCDVQEVHDGEYNVLARIGPDDGVPGILLNSHLDTVPVGNPELWSMHSLGGGVRDGRIYGRGASDCKGGVAAMMAASVALARSGQHLSRSVMLACVAAETRGHYGTQALVDAGQRADFAIVGEYSEGKNLAVAYRGALWARLRLTGRTSHPGRANPRLDTIRSAVEHVLPWLYGYEFDFVHHDLVPDPQLTITQVTAGHARNVIADSCEIAIDVRTVPGQDLREIWLDLREGVTRTLRENSEVTVEFELDQAIDSFEVDRTSDGVACLKESVLDVTGAEPGVMGKVGVCDGNIMVNEAEIPTVIFGPGNPSGMTVDEFCDIQSLVRTAQIYAVTAYRLCR